MKWPITTWFGATFIVGLMVVFGPVVCSAADYADGYRAFEKIVSGEAQTKDVLSRHPISKMLRPMEKIVDREGNEILSYAKFAGNYPVFGEKSVVIFPKNSSSPVILRGLEVSRKHLGELAFLSQNPPKPKISLDRAQQIATQDLRQRAEYLGSAVPESWLSEPEVVMYRATDGTLRLTHHLVFPARYHGIPTTKDIFVDAENGEILSSVARLYDLADDTTTVTGTGYGLRTDELKEFPVAQVDGKYWLKDALKSLEIFVGDLDRSSLDDDHVWDAVGPERANNQRAEVELYLNFSRIVDFFKQHYDYSWDGALQAVAHVPNPQDGSPNFNNAYFHPWYRAFFFGDGSGAEGGFDFLTRGLDVAAHEFGHGFQESQNPLYYQGESGALNEHVADLIGACVDDDDWMIGDDVNVGQSAGKGLRNLQDPTSGHGDLITAGMTFQQWRDLNKGRPYGDRIYPDHLSKKITCESSEDNGGVHVNNCIFNKFSYLASTGEGLGSAGLGRQLLLDIYVRAMKDHLYSSRASFVEFRDALLAAADLHLAGNPQKDEFLKTLKGAFAAIGLEKTK